MSEARQPLDLQTAARIQHERNLEHGRQLTQGIQGESLALLNSVLVTGQTAIRAILLLSGGASVAVLAFMGHLLTNPGSPVIKLAGPMLAALELFVLSTAFAGLTAGLTYFCQWRYRCEAETRYPEVIKRSLKGEECKDLYKFGWGDFLQLVTCAVGIAAFVLFIMGCLDAGDAMRKGLEVLEGAK
jgi:hypothetical protein